MNIDYHKLFIATSAVVKINRELKNYASYSRVPRTRLRMSNLSSGKVPRHAETVKLREP